MGKTAGSSSSGLSLGKKAAGQRDARPSDAEKQGPLLKRIANEESGC